MSVNHTFSDALFARLQSHAVPLVDSIDTVIERALDALDSSKTPTSKGSSGAPRDFNPATPPNLAHTTPKTMSLCGKVADKADVNWNALMHATIREAAKKGLDPEQIHKLMVVPCVIGEKTVQGYKYLADVGVSVQGQDANGAWKQTYHIANAMGFAINVTFVWQDKASAAMPNVTGSFTVEAD